MPDLSEELGFRERDPCRRVEEPFYKGGVPESDVVALCKKLSWAGYINVNYEIDNTPDRTSGIMPTFTVTSVRFVCACLTLPPPSSPVSWETKAPADTPVTPQVKVPKRSKRQSKNKGPSEAE